MNDAPAPEPATTDLPLQAQLMGSLALVFILSAIAGLIGCYLFWVLGVAPFSLAFAGFADSTAWFLMGALLFGVMATRSGLARRRCPAPRGNRPSPPRSRAPRATGGRNPGGCGTSLPAPAPARGSRGSAGP